MSDNLLQPLRKIKLGERELTLLGDFAALRLLQQTFDKDLIHLQRAIMYLRQDEIARFITAVLQSNGDKAVTEEEIGGLIVDEVGVGEPAYEQLKGELMSFLAVAMTPKKDRLKKAEELAAVLEKLQLAASPGQTTNSSA